MNVKVLAITPAILLACQAGHAADFDPADFVIAHNRWRAYAGITEKLSYSAALAMTAQSWADNLKRTQHCQLRHSKPDGRYGENLYWAGAVQWSNGHRELQKVTPAQVVDSWGSERAYYDRKRNSCAPGKSAATTRSSSGAAPKGSAVRWPSARTPKSRSGSASTSPRETGWVKDLTSGL